MSKFLFRKSVLLLVLATIGGIGSVYAEATCDLRCWNFSPGMASDVISNVCPVTVILRNEGDKVESFSVRVSVNDEVKFTERIDRVLDSYSTTQVNDTVRLTNTVALEYGANTVIVCELLPPDGTTDANPDNNTLTKTFVAPTEVVFPYTWNPSDCVSYFPVGTNSMLSSWKYFDVLTPPSYLQSGKGTNWRGALVSNVFSVPVGEAVKFAFDYRVDGTVGAKTTILAMSPEATDTLYAGELNPSSVYSTLSMSFKSKGVTRISIQSSLANALAYGSLYVSNINFVKDEPDICVASILGPALSSIATGQPVNISARFSNTSGFDVDNPVFTYRFGETKVSESYAGVLKSGESVDYVFRTPLSVTDNITDTLTVGCEAASDKNPSNDAMSKELSFYAPIAFPYYTDFETDLKLWTMIDNDGDGETWKAAQYAMGDQEATMLTHVATASAMDYAFTPAIQMPAGKSRVAFYVAGVYGRGNSHINLLMGKSPDVGSMSKIMEYDVASQGWYMAYAPVDVAEAAVYYFAIEATASSDQIGVDFFRVDRENDLCIETVAFDTESGFKKSSATVTLSLYNYGVDPQSNIDVRYYLNSDDNYVDGRITATIQPGERYAYTFDKPADISEPGEYALIGEIVTKVGPDSRNDMIYGQSITHYKVQNVPYACDFEDLGRSAQWSFVSVGSDNPWLVGRASNNAYDGSWVLAHTSTNTAVGSSADEWAFSECIEIPAGKYDLSFFYRTMRNWTTEPYYQSFQVKIGSSASPDAMTIPVAEFKDVTVAGAAYARHRAVVDIPVSGEYYIGFHNNSPRGGGNGNTYIDHITLAEHGTPGAPIPYKADFAGNLDEWELTNPNIRNWAYNATEGAMELNRSSYYGSMEGSEGLLTSPKLHLPAGATVTVALEYTATMVTETAGDMRMALYAADVNLPDEFEQLTTFDRTADYASVSYKFTVGEDDRDCYFGMRSNMDVLKSNYNIKVKSFEVKSDRSGIDNVEQTSSLAIRINGNQLTVDASEEVQRISVYDISGRTIGSVSSGFTVELPGRGAYIVAVDMASGREVRKVAY